MNSELFPLLISTHPISSHIVDNPDTQSEVELLKQYGPDVPIELLISLSNLFQDLRSLVDDGLLNYPYSLR